jgi:hypothetical protein
VNFETKTFSALQILTALTAQNVDDELQAIRSKWTDLQDKVAPLQEYVFAVNDAEYAHRLFVTISSYSKPVTPGLAASNYSELIALSTMAQVRHQMGLSLYTQNALPQPDLSATGDPWALLTHLHAVQVRLAQVERLKDQAITRIGDQWWADLLDVWLAHHASRILMASVVADQVSLNDETVRYVTKMVLGEGPGSLHAPLPEGLKDYVVDVGGVDLSLRIGVILACLKNRLTTLAV